MELTAKRKKRQRRGLAGRHADKPSTRENFSCTGLFDSACAAMIDSARSTQLYVVTLIKLGRWLELALNPQAGGGECTDLMKLAFYANSQDEVVGKVHERLAVWRKYMWDEYGGEHGGGDWVLFHSSPYIIQTIKHIKRNNSHKDKRIGQIVPRDYDELRRNKAGRPMAKVTKKRQ